MSRAMAALGRHDALLTRVLLVLGVVWFFAESFPAPAQVDDAFIAYRYARNLVGGHGLVYNLGSRVEGYTSFSWVLLVAAGMKAGLRAQATSFYLGLSSSLALLGATFGYARLLAPDRNEAVAALAPILVIASPSFAVWSTSGLETPLYAALVVGALIAQGHGRPAAAVLISVLATLTRPEGVLVAGVVLGAEFSRGGASRRRSLLLAAAYALFGAALTAFRLAYFGAPLPNTFYAKVGGVPWGWAGAYLLAFFVQTAAPLLLPAALGAARSRVALTGASYVLLLTVYILLVGGDVFRYSRFFLPAIPVLVALALGGASLPGDGFAVRAARGSIPVALAWLAFGTPGGLVAFVANLGLSRAFIGSVPRLLATTAIALMAGIGGSRLVPEPPVDLERHLPSMASITAERRWTAMTVQRATYAYLERSVQNITGAMAQRKRRPRRVAAEGIGFLGWYFEGDVIDLLGLVDPVVARSPARAQKRYGVPGHQRSNADYVLSLSPDYIFVPDAEAPFQLPATRDLWDNPGFTEHYRWDPMVTGYVRFR